MERQGFPPGVPAWIELEAREPDAAIRFYGGIFGWQFVERMPPGSGARYLVATLDGRQVAAVTTSPDTPTTAAWRTSVATDSADRTAERVRAAGGAVLRGPFDVLDNRAAVCADPSGAIFGLWQPGGIRGAETVNAPNSWNFSELNTDDAAAAERFYGEVFGWAVDVVDMGALSGRMVRLPGYADFLEQFDPGLRERHADFGAPPGFSECVAWILPLESGVPHWSVTFSVADADAIAARAETFGGSVAVQPFDLPPTRSAVLIDPGGARLTVSAFRPS